MNPTTVLKNQYGEVSANYSIPGGSGIDVSFTVDSSNANGLGVSGVSGSVSAVYMHTSATPAGPFNPPVGYVYLQMAKSYPGFVSTFQSMAAPVAGSALTSTTANSFYIITSLGNTSAAQWLAAGVPAGFTAAVGMGFFAIATGAIGGTGTVKVPGVAAITSFDLVGDPGVSSVPASGSGGAFLTVRCLAPTISTGAYVSPMIPTAPADGTLIRMRFSFFGTVMES